MRWIAIAGVALLVAVWAATPLVRGLLLVRHGEPGSFSPPPSLVYEEVTFTAVDGVRLAGSYVPAEGARATVVLVHGFKNSRADMLEHALFLHGAGFAVLLYDSRGCGASGGTFGAGATEDRDVRGAVSYLKRTTGSSAIHVAVLGVSLGAGAALLAAARDTRIDAVIADSSWADERVQLDRMGAITAASVALPLLPYEPALVDALVGGRLEDARPSDEIARIAPRPVFLIHSADDQNATTPLAGARRLFSAAGDPKEIWIAPSGGHAGALAAQRDEYVRRVIAFLRRVAG